MANFFSYNSNPRLKKPNAPIAFSAHQREELRKCAADPLYFIENYYKIVSTDVGLIQFVPFAFQERMAQEFHDNRFVVCKLPRQMGKALDIETPVATPSGWTTMGDLRVGDTILGADGKPTKVTFATEVMHDHTCHVVRFDTGDEVVADEDHLWEVGHTDWSRPKVLTTKQLIAVVGSKRKNANAGMPYIQCARPLDLPEAALPIDPYVLGLWLGDGARADGRMTASPDDFAFYRGEYERRGFQIRVGKNGDRKPILWTVCGLHKQLRLAGLLDNKRIPEVYLRGSIEQRLQLLRGLMDTDGSCSVTGNCQFYQKDLQLIYQVRELLGSLGIKSRVVSKLIDNQLYYTINFATALDVFALPRKRVIHAQGKGHPKNTRHYIHAIRPTKSVPVRCIQVDNPDHLFLCSKAFIPTHNTTIVAAYLLWYVLFNDFKEVLIAAHKDQAAREILKRVKLAVEHLPHWLQQGVIRWDQTKIEFENGSSILAVATSSSAARGGSFALVYLDEYAFVAQNLADEFFGSVYPTISSGSSTKMIVTSTPNGLNQFFTMWDDAEKGRSKFKPVSVHWSEHPKRDDKWAEQERANIGPARFAQEYECVGPDTLVTVRDKYTQTVRQMRIADLYDELHRVQAHP